MRSTRRQFVGGLVASAACGTDATLAAEPIVEPEAAVVDEQLPAWRMAMGPLEDLSPDQAAWLVDAAGHEPPSARALAIAARHHEAEQTVVDYLLERPNRPTPERRTLVLCPLGNFPFDVIELGGLVGLVRTPPLGELADLLSTSFGLPVEVLPERPLESRLFLSRRRGDVLQVDVHSLLEDLAPELPEHAYAMLALVNIDLYASPEQHYAFGWSMHRGRLGVASFARFNPSLDGGGVRPDDLDRVICHRSARLLAHEVAHMFGLAHCTYFRCLLGPVDVLADLDALAAHLCPVCRMKLLRGADVDPIATTCATVASLEKLQLADDAAWARLRTRSIHVG